jgi:hypothetical protein
MCDVFAPIFIMFHAACINLQIIILYRHTSFNSTDPVSMLSHSSSCNRAMRLHKLYGSCSSPTSVNTLGVNPPLSAQH